jgi:hypothetical protein
MVDNPDMQATRTTTVTAKPWWSSKMLWTNAVAMVGGVGTFVMTGNPEALLTSGLGLVNFALRLFTKQPLE